MIDASGHRWMVSRQPPAARQGDAVYVSLWTPDARAAERFYRAVLGFAPDVHGGHERPTALLCYAVNDLDAVVARVRAAGGTAEAPQTRPYGRVSDAVDDQGLPFALRQGPAGPVDRLVLCPARPMCWRGLVQQGDRPLPPGRAECTEPHYWETFAAIPCPPAPSPTATSRT